MVTLTWRTKAGLAAGTFGILCVAIALCQEPQEKSDTDTAGKKLSVSRSKGEDVRVSVEVARDRAKLMHEIYSTTLDVIHHRYFHGDRAVVPARAMEDVFSEMKHQSKVEARWISINTKAMSIDHDPKSDFEKRVAKEFTKGKLEIEAVEDGYYRRAGAISLHAGCLGCHEGMFQSPSKVPKYAGLVISVPILNDSDKANRQETLAK